MKDLKSYIQQLNKYNAYNQQNTRQEIGLMITPKITNLFMTYNLV